MASAPWLRYRSPAKWNRNLRVLNQRADFYHNLLSGFQFLGYGDLLLVRKADGAFSLNCEGESSERLQAHPEENLVLRAARLLKEFLGEPRLGAEFRLVKRIPVGSGLGGGSSNAATTLLALEQLWASPLSQVQREQLGEQLGSDVPLFLRGVAGVLEGRGEIIHPHLWPETWLSVLWTEEPISTPKAFQLLSEANPDRLKTWKREEVLSATDFHNDFEKVLEVQAPKSWAWLQRLRSAGIATTLTGSGSALVARSETRAKASALSRWLRSQKVRNFCTLSLNRAPSFYDLPGGQALLRTPASRHSLNIKR